MKQITFIAVAIFIATIMTACGQTSRYVPEGWKKLETHEFSILYPDTFELTYGVMVGTRFVLLAPQSSPDDMFRENVNLRIYDLRSLNISFDNLIENTKGFLTRFVTDIKFIENKRIENDDLTFHSIIVTGKQGLFNLKWLQRIMYKNGRAYNFTFTAEAEQFDNYIEVATKIMDSFKFR